jgi:hypothetical protein
MRTVGPRAFRTIDALGKFSTDNTTGNISGAPSLNALEDLQIAAAYPPLFALEYVGLSLKVSQSFDLASDRPPADGGKPAWSRFPPGTEEMPSEQREVYQNGALNLTWNGRLTLFGIRIPLGTRNTDIKGMMVLRFNFPGKPGTPIAGFFLGVMQKPPGGVSPRIMITFKSDTPVRPQDPDLLKLTDVQLFGNVLFGGKAAVEELGPGFGESDALSDVSALNLAPNTPPTGTIRVRDRMETGGFGFSGGGGAVDSSVIMRVTLELLDEADMVIQSTSTAGTRLRRVMQGGATYGAKIQMLDFVGVGSGNGETVPVDYWFDPGMQCRFRVRYTLAGVLNEL